MVTLVCPLPECQYIRAADNSLYISFLSFRLLELHSPDGQHTVVLRCKDGPTANSWFTAIHTNIAALLPQTLAHINSYMGASASASTHPHLKHIGWLAEQVFSALYLIHVIIPFSCSGLIDSPQYHVLKPSSPSMRTGLLKCYVR